MSNLLVQNIKHTNGTTAQTIDSNGRITAPNRPVFYAKNGGDTGSVTLSNNYKLSTLGTWTTPVNRGNIFNTSNGKFTCTVAGVYQLQGLITVSGTSTDAGDGWGIRFFKNGSSITDVELAYAPGPISGYEAHTSATIYEDLNVGDFIEIGIHGSDDSFNVLNWTLGGHLIG